MPRWLQVELEPLEGDTDSTRGQLVPVGADPVAATVEVSSPPTAAMLISECTAHQSSHDPDKSNDHPTSIIVLLVLILSAITPHCPTISFAVRLVKKNTSGRDEHTVHNTNLMLKFPCWC